ncbi:MAG: S41 family peptidase, partial [Lachnospiraceae bacterium]|nr:S41 family peptidase [Lachnospiraceae bacterium]
FYHTVYKGLKTAKLIADETLENAGSAAAIANREPLVVDAGDKSDFDKKMDTILQYMDYYYNGDIDMDAMYDAMLHAAVSSLGDPYSVYYSPKEYSALLESSSGVYSGIGATISQDMTTKAMTIVTPFTNSPAYNAGLCSGDQIVAVDGESVIGEDLSDVVTKIKGLEGTTVNITVLRDGQEITFTVKRARIEVEFVSYKMLDDKIGYILVSEFEETTADQFSAAIADLQKKGMKGLVVDIRNNPGGLYNIVCDMLDRILPKGSLLVYTEDKYGRKAYEYAETTDTVDIPIAVIVNGNSASASEIFSGALQDYGKAVIVGTQSFGKGIVQSVIPIMYDGSGVKLTSSRYFTPNGVCIHGTGITPDVVVELEEGLEKINIELRDHDNQIDAAVEEVKKLMR